MFLWIHNLKIKLQKPRGIRYTFNVTLLWSTFPLYFNNTSKFSYLHTNQIRHLMLKEADIKSVSHFPNLEVGGKTQSYILTICQFSIYQLAKKEFFMCQSSNRNRVRPQAHLQLKVLVPENNTGLTCRMQIVLLTSRGNLWSMEVPSPWKPQEGGGCSAEKQEVHRHCQSPYEVQ